MYNYICMLFIIIVILVWLEYIYLRKYNMHKYLNPECYLEPFLETRKQTKNIDFVKKKKIIFAGLARNIETKIQKNIENCILLGSFFESYKIVIFENDSNDKTRISCVIASL